MDRTIKITTDNKLLVINMPWDLNAWEKEIGTECTETVKTKIRYEVFPEEVVMIVDESGRLKDKPINPVASFLYGTPEHGNPIYGDILLGIQKGLDIMPLNKIDEILQSLQYRFPFLSGE